MRISTVVISLLVAAAAVAQSPPNNVIGLSRVVQTSRLLRPDAMPSPGGTANVDVVNRLDPADYRHYDDDGTGQMQIAAMELALNDANDTTTENFSCVWYGEDVANPGHPDANGPLIRITLQMPPPWFPNQPNITWYIGLGFGPALTVPNNTRVFYGIGLEPAPNQAYPNDGLSMLSITDNANDSTHDAPGRGMFFVPFGTYTSWHLTLNGLPSAPSAYLGGMPGQREVLYCDMGGTGAGGTPIAVTNQASYPVSGPGWGHFGNGGTTSPLSGLHPDVFGWNPGRQDDPGYVLYDRQMTGNLALMFCGFTTTGPVPVAALPIFDPNSFGVICLDTGAALSFFGLIDNDGFAECIVPFNSSTRAFVQANPGIDLIWQGFAFDFGGAQPRVHATGCARQHL